MMSPEGRRHRQSLPHDILSNLPDSIIDVILMRLPCRDAVRTSILSNKWRYHWCRLTEFKLHEADWGLRKDLLVPTCKFTKIINQLLTHHEGPISKFGLYICTLKSCPKIDDFLYFLSMNDIQHLVLHFPHQKPYKVPFSLFTCSLLRHLSLRDCFIHPPSFFEGFDRLTSLELYRVTVCPELLGSLISHCPLLECLVLKISEVLDVIEVSAPMLKSFNFSGEIRSIRLKNAPLLAKVSLECVECPSMEAEYFGFANFFGSCSSLERLLLNYDNLERNLDAPFDLMTRLLSDITSIKNFYLPQLIMSETYQLWSALFLIRSFPNLEYLEIWFLHEDDEDYGILECLKMEHFADLTLNHLREIKLEYFIGTTREMQLIKLLFAKCPVLERVLIESYILDDEPPDKKSEVLDELSKFWRASPEAQVVCRKFQTMCDNVMVVNNTFRLV